MNSDKTSSDQLQTIPSIDKSLGQAIECLTTPSATPPVPEAVVEAMLIAEKTAKQTKVRHAYPQLLGTWRLGFITGTKRSRQRARVILRDGRIPPKCVQLSLSHWQ